VGVVEAKKAGVTLSSIEAQTRDYAANGARARRGGGAHQRDAAAPRLTGIAATARSGRRNRKRCLKATLRFSRWSLS
jgi:hypothetical protein